MKPKNVIGPGKRANNIPHFRKIIFEDESNFYIFDIRNRLKLKDSDAIVIPRKRKSNETGNAFVINKNTAINISEENLTGTTNTLEKNQNKIPNIFKEKIQEATCISGEITNSKPRIIDKHQIQDTGPDEKHENQDLTELNDDDLGNGIILNNDSYLMDQNYFSFNENDYFKQFDEFNDDLNF